MVLTLAGFSAFGQGNHSNATVPVFLPEYVANPCALVDNELEPANEGSGEDIYCNPLVLDGQLLDYKAFGPSSKGELKLMAGVPTSLDAVSIDFTVQLRRDGEILESSSMGFKNKAYQSIEISSVLQFAQPGDELIITPSLRKYWKAKRILKVLGGC